MASICQMCGHTGFQEVMIYCRQCRVACEHKYCLFKYPKKGEKFRWYCEGCRPTFFPPSSPKKQEVDAETCKLYPKSIQKLQNHNPDLKNSNLDVFCRSQLETVREEAENIKSSSSDLCESKKFNKQRTLTASNDRAIGQKAPYSQSNHLIPPSTSGDLIKHEVSPPETITHRMASDQDIEVCRPEASIQNIHGSYRPIADFIWRGCISFGNEEFIPFRAHGSSQACQRVFDAAKSLPPILPMDRYLRSELQQSIFKNGPPTVDKIGLYLLPDVYAKQKHVSGLVDDIITKNLMFVYIFNEIELLVFPSCVLPEEYHKINDQYYLWGAFRNKQLQATVTSTNHDSEQFAMNIQDKNANAVSVTNSFKEYQKPVFESKMKHSEDIADTDANLFGSPITEKLKRILARINEKHTQNNDDNSPCKRRTIEHIQAKYREEETDISRCTEIRKSKNALNNKENALNQRDRENSSYSTRSKTRGDESRKRERSRYEDQAYNNLTKRQKALYDSKKKEQNRDKTETKKHIEDSKKRKFQEDDDCGSNLYVEKRRCLDDEIRTEKQKSHGTTATLSMSWTEKQKQEREKDDVGGELKSTCVEGVGNESSASPVSSICSEEQKQKVAMDICDNTEEQEEEERRRRRRRFMQISRNI